jgi:hypothetical protein
VWKAARLTAPGSSPAWRCARLEHPQQQRQQRDRDHAGGEVEQHVRERRALGGHAAADRRQRAGHGGADRRADDQRGRLLEVDRPVCSAVSVVATAALEDCITTVMPMPISHRQPGALQRRGRQRARSNTPDRPCMPPAASRCR